jgi:microcystin degradation protein MlrC
LISGDFSPEAALKAFQRRFSVGDAGERMRIAIGGIYHESNSFSARLTTLEDFRSSSLLTGGAIIDYWRGTNSEVAGFLDGIEAIGGEAVPTLVAWGMPSGPVAARDLEELAGELARRIAQEQDIAGILLVCHGAMVCETRTDADAFWLHQVRKAVGRHVPIVATLDFHANVTPEMVAAVDAVVGYRTYPHTDYRDRGKEAAEILAKTLRGETHPIAHCVQVPVVPNLLTQFTACAPMRCLMDAADDVRRAAGCISASVFGGFQWADVPHHGISVVTVSEKGDPDTVRAGEAIARKAWDLRHSFRTDLVSVEDAVRQANEPGPTPVVLVDTGDNVGGGAPGDGTIVLKELLEQHSSGAVVLVHDPETVQRAIETGVRGRARFRIGGKTDALHGEPVETEGDVRLLSSGLFVNVGPMREGLREDMGRTAVIDARGVTIIATEKRSPMWNLEQLRSLGIEPTRCRTIVVKAAIAHRAAYSPIAGRMVELDTPGITALDIRRFTYRHQRRPVFPLDDDFHPLIQDQTTGA